MRGAESGAKVAVAVASAGVRSEFKYKGLTAPAALLLPSCWPAALEERQKEERRKGALDLPSLS